MSRYLLKSLARFGIVRLSLLIGLFFIVTACGKNSGLVADNPAITKPKIIKLEEQKDTGLSDLKIFLDKDTYLVGQDVRVTFYLVNDSRYDRKFTFRGPCQFLIALKKGDQTLATNKPKSCAGDETTEIVISSFSAGVWKKSLEIPADLESGKYIITSALEGYDAKDNTISVINKKL